MKAVHDRARGAAMARPGRHQPAPQRVWTRRACANIDLVAAEIVERFQHQPEGLVAQRIVARLTLDKIVGLEHRHRTTDDDHRRVDRLEPRIEKLVLEPEFVQHVADCGHEEFAPREREQLSIGLPKRGHDRPLSKLVTNIVAGVHNHRLADSLLMTLVIRAQQPKGGDHVEVLLYACHLLLPTCPHAMSPFMSVTYVSPHPGSKLIVLGAVHGNEICGTLAIRRVIDELDRGALALVSGQLTLVPVTNPLAYKNRRRNGERNLNRNLAPSSVPRDYEDHIANWLCPLLARHEVLLDLHSFQAPGAAFVMLGPENNQGPIEPFSQAAEEEALALRL